MSRNEILQHEDPSALNQKLKEEAADLYLDFQALIERAQSAITASNKTISMQARA